LSYFYKKISVRFATQIGCVIFIHIQPPPPPRVSVTVVYNMNLLITAQKALCFDLWSNSDQLPRCYGENSAYCNCVKVPVSTRVAICLSRQDYSQVKCELDSNRTLGLCGYQFNPLTLRDIILSNQVTCFVKQHHSTEANSSSAGIEIHSTLWNPTLFSSFLKHTAFPCPQNINHI
jgi:hypothetical protein